ncbi:MAG: copper amine oxidase N-terminal domain-containing protein [Symbiobacteriaceae bacterium]|nr:copper amine oxidase N-terminal domain-containing protein [Symbiobacteriaceae bacterium]
MRKEWIWLLILTFSVSLPHQLMAAEEEQVRVIAFSGFIDTLGVPFFEPGYAIVVPRDYLEPEEGNYLFCAMSATGRELARTRFAPHEVEELEGIAYWFWCEALFPAHTHYFTMLAPSGEVMGNLPVPTGSPQAYFNPLSFDSTEPFTLTWSWNSTPEYPLYAELYYIYDGFSDWLESGITDNSYDIDFAGLDLWDSSEALFLLVVSDGINTLEVYSNLFAVPGRVELKTGGVYPVEAPPPYAPSREDRSAPIVLTIDSFIITHGETFLPEPPLAPQIINQRSMLPLRYLVETVLGGTVGYDPATAAITADLPAHRLLLRIGDPTITIDGVDYNFGQAPVIVDNYTLVPLRTFEPILDALEWHSDTRRVVIYP